MMIKLSNLLQWLSIIILAVLMVTGCGQKVYTLRSLSFPIEETKNIPLHVGLYIDPKFESYIRDPGPQYLYKIFMGKALTKCAEDVVKKTFKESVTIYTMDPDLIPKTLDVLVIPEINKIYAFQELSLKGIPPNYAPVTVSIRWNIIDMDRKMLYTNVFTGEAKYRTRPGFKIAERIVEAYAKATEEQFAKAYAGISTTNWWQSIKETSH